MNLALLRKEARATAERMRGRLEAAIGEDRDLTADEQSAQDDDKAKLARQQARIAELEALETASAGLADTGDTGATAGSVGTVRASVPATARPALDNGGFRHLADFAHAVRLANPAAGSSFRMDDRLANVAAPTNVHGESGDTPGAYLVPAEYRQEIADLVYAGDDPILTLIDPSPTSSNRVVGLGDESTPWGSSGVQAYWRVESEQMTATKAALTPRETKVNELYAFVLATEELLEDAPRVANLLTRKASAAIRWKLAEGYVAGDGVEKPLGFLASDALISVAKEAAQAADTIVRQNVAKMFARMINPTQASWIANPDTMPQLMELKTEAGVPVWFPNYEVAPGGILLGRPVLFTEHNPTVGDVGDLTFVNPNGYEAFRKQNGVQFADSIHLYFDYNVRAFRWIFRAGGQPVLSAPITPPKSSATKSHFVAIAARA